MPASALIRPARRFAAAIARATRGVAMTEFAMSLPVLLTLGLAGLETANYVLAHMRVSAIAQMTADNASRVRDSIDESDIAQLFTGATLAGERIAFATNGRIILTDLEQHPTDATKQWVRWQRCAGSLALRSEYARPRAADSSEIRNGTETTRPSSYLASPALTGFGPAGNQITAQAGTAVMVVEVVYNYQPIVSNTILGNTQIKNIRAFNVRQRNNHVLSNRNSLPAAACN